jgi:hypothetical protein
MKYLLLIVPFMASGLVAWLFWFPVRLGLFSLIPTTADYAWAIKLVITILVAYFGGIGLPFFIFVVTMMFVLAILKD